MVDDILKLAARGWRVHPCRPDDKRPFTRWSTQATVVAGQIETWWEHRPDALVAVCTGDGLVVVDVDPRNGGIEQHDLMHTLTARTRSGGWHHYFHSDTPVASSIGRLAPGIDIRGTNGYVIAPPSPGWTWVDQDAEITPLPPLLLMAIERAEYEARHSFFMPEEHVAAGVRHDYLVRFAGWFVANELGNGDLNELADEVFAHALQVCDPWPPEELPGVERNIRQLCRWVLDRESARP